MTEFSQNSSLTTAADRSDALIRVALILSSKLECLGWGIVVDSQQDMQVVGQFSSLASAFAFLKTDAVDVVLVDEAMLTRKACDAISRRERASQPRFLLITRHPIHELQVELQYSFASQYLLKGLSAADLLAAIRDSGSASVHVQNTKSSSQDDSKTR